MDDRLQMGEYAESECLDIASFSNTFVLFKHLCHLFAELVGDAYDVAAQISSGYKNLWNVRWV